MYNRGEVSEDWRFLLVTEEIKKKSITEATKKLITEATKKKLITEATKKKLITEESRRDRSPKPKYNSNPLTGYKKKEKNPAHTGL